MKYRIVQGNIVDAKVDAIVLPANTMLKEGSGASEAIFEAAGRKKLAKKCKEIGFCELGSAVPTLGYDLDCKCIIHAVVPAWIDGEHDEYNLLSSAYVSALQLADVMECKSIAFPLLASGNNGFDLDLAFEIAVKNIELFEGKQLEDVVIVLFGNHIAEIVKSKGYEVTVLPRNLEKDKLELEKREKGRKLLKEAKEVAHLFAEEQIHRGIEFFKDEKNREKAIQMGVKALNLAMAAATIMQKKDQ